MDADHRRMQTDVLRELQRPSPNQLPPTVTRGASGPGQYLMQMCDLAEGGQLPPEQFVEIVRGVAVDLGRQEQTDGQPLDRNGTRTVSNGAPRPGVALEG